LALVERGAFPGAQGELLVAPEDDTMAVYRPLLQSMHDLDMVELTEPGSSSWRLTQRGMASISYTWQLKDAARVLEPRAGIPLKDASTWEMMVQLEEQGWEWQALSSKARQARPVQPKRRGASQGLVYLGSYCQS